MSGPAAGIPVAELEGEYERRVRKDRRALALAFDASAAAVSVVAVCVNRVFGVVSLFALRQVRGRR